MIRPRPLFTNCQGDKAYELTAAWVQSQGCEGCLGVSSASWMLIGVEQTWRYISSPVRPHACVLGCPSCSRGSTYIDITLHQHDKDPFSSAYHCDFIIAQLQIPSCLDSRCLRRVLESKQSHTLAMPSTRSAEQPAVASNRMQRWGFASRMPLLPATKSDLVVCGLSGKRCLDILHRLGRFGTLVLGWYVAPWEICGAVVPYYAKKPLPLANRYSQKPPLIAFCQSAGMLHHVSSPPAHLTQ